MTKTELMEKIIKAKLTQEEIRGVIEFAETLKAKRGGQK